MADTHINAYFADVDTKQTAVAQANAELQAANARLWAKKKEIGWVEPPAPQELADPPANTGTTFKKR